MRQVVLDTETTGLEPELGHRIIEIGCVELLNRRPTGRHFHRYVNPERDIDEGALAVHGISRADLLREPCFRDIVEELLVFIGGAQLVIHNAAFDVAFLEAELKLVDMARETARTVTSLCTVLDTLALAREMHPGQRNSLDALCKRYEVDNSRRELHGALLDAQILAEVYLAMTGGQSSLLLDAVSVSSSQSGGTTVHALVRPAVPLRVLAATEAELLSHAALLEVIRKASGGRCVWHALEAGTADLAMSQAGSGA